MSAAMNKSPYASVDCLELAIQIGYGLMASGAETVRVEESVTRILQAYRLQEVEVFAVANYIHASSRTVSGEPIGLGKRVHSTSSNLSKVDRLNALTRTICQTVPDPVSALSDVYEVIHTPSYPQFVHMSAVALSAFSFALLVGAGALAALWTAAASFVMLLCMIPLKKYYSNPLFNNLLGSMLITLFDYPMLWTNFSSDMFPAMIGSFMYFFPGIALINSIRDLIAGDYGAGLSKLVEAILLAIAVAVGSGIMLMILEHALGH